MKNIRIVDGTLLSDSTYTFKQKLQIARLLDELRVDILDFPVLQDNKQDLLLVRTVASFLTHSRISIGVNNKESLQAAKAFLPQCDKAMVRLEFPVSTVGMEYTCHKKAPKMLEWVANMLAELQPYEVEVCALDATRAEPAFLQQVADTALAGGAKYFTVCDDAAVAMPDTFAAFVDGIEAGSMQKGVCTHNTNGLALANALVAVKAGATIVKTTAHGKGVDLENWGTLLQNCGLNEGLASNLDYNRLHHTLQSIQGVKGAAKAIEGAANLDFSLHLDKEDSAETVRKAVGVLGYELSEQDHALVYEEFLRVAAKKTVGAKELDAIVASTAMQVPSLYKVESFVINNSNLFSSSAQVTLSRDGVQLQGIRFADGPIAAAFAALEEIVGKHYELDDFQIAAITEGQGAVGKAMVKLRYEGKLYSGTGISTDIIGAAIRAYVAAVNKIAYEET